MIPGVPPCGVGGGWMGWGVVRGCTLTTCTCTCTHAHAHAYNIIGNSQVFPNGGGHLHEIIMFTTHACASVHVHVCACMCTCVGGIPNHPPPPSNHPPTPTAAGSSKHRNSISLELIEIIRFCLKILYL